MATLTVGTNTYVTEAQADAYFDTRLNSSVWTSASSADKIKALIMSARKMQGMNWLGTKYLSTQTLEHPRANTGISTVTDSVVHDDIKDGQCEIALVYLTQDVTKSKVNTDFPVRKKVGDLEVEYAEQSHSNELYFRYSYELLSKFLSSRFRLERA